MIVPGRSHTWILLTALGGAACASEPGGSDEGTQPVATASAPHSAAAGSSASPGAAQTAAGSGSHARSTSPGIGSAGVGTVGAAAGAAAGGVNPGDPNASRQTGALGAAGAGAAATAGSAGMSAMDGAAGQQATETGATVPAPICESKVPAEFELNTRIGGGGSQDKDSAHFAVYNASDPDRVLNFMEAAHKCLIEDWCFRSPGLPAQADDSGPYYKTNVYSNPVMSAGGLTYWDEGAKLAYMNILASQINDPRTTVHEYGHAITMSEYNWIDQKRTGFWWESIANWVAYSFLTSPYCESARDQYGVEPASTIIDQMHTLQTVYGMSYTVICNDQNYYQAWPFFTYLTNNPDGYPGLGKMAVADLMRKYKIGSNETPLHTLERIAAPVKVQTILGRYWARLAYMDIDLPVAHQDFMKSRGSLDFAGNLDAAGSGMYKVKSSRQPQYGGANITPLKPTGNGEISVMVTNLGNGRSESNFTATLAVHAADDTVRYVDLPDGAGQAMVASGEEVSLVVVNTPDELYLFDPQYVGSPENIGLSYQVQLTGAEPTQ